MTGTGVLGIGVVQVSGAGTGTPGVGSGAGSSRTGTGLQDTGAGHSDGPSPMREPLQTEGHEDIVPQEVTSGRRRPKWLQDTLKEAKDAGEPKRIMRRSKAPDKICSYLATLIDITHSDLYLRRQLTS